MIPIDKEEKIRSLLRAGLPDREIARRVELPHRTIINIRRDVEAVKLLTKKQHDTARELLLSGLPAKAVAASACIPRAAVVAIRRLAYLHKRAAGDTRECPTCGSIMRPLPERLPHRKSIVNDLGAFCVATAEDRIHLFRIAEDIVALDDLRLIPNPLFYHLARRAERTLENIYAKTQKENPAERTRRERNQPERAVDGSSVAGRPELRSRRSRRTGGKP